MRIEIDAELDQLYSCSKWNKRMPVDKIVDLHAEVGRKGKTKNL